MSNNTQLSIIIVYDSWDEQTMTETIRKVLNAEEIDTTLRGLAQGNDSCN